METMATLPPHITEALNILLAEERASVECEVAFASGAGEYGEREAFATMGREDVAICDALHEELAAADAHVTPQVSPSSDSILALELYDDRLRAFAQHQRAISERAGHLLGELSEGELQRTVQRLSQLHIWHALWAEQHADEFAATRSWENGRRPRPGKTPAPAADTTGVVGGSALLPLNTETGGSAELGEGRGEGQGSDGANAHAQTPSDETTDGVDGA